MTHVLPARAVPRDDTFDTPFALGWDHARHGLTPPLERLCINPRLRHGYQAGRAAFGTRLQPADAAVRAWLQLRLDALAAGRAYESVRLTPAYLARLAVTHCPVTREPLAPGWRVGRLRGDAGYAAGHLARLSPRAEAARGGLAAGAALALLRRGAADAGPGLAPAQWRRLALLASFVQPLPHAEAAALPLLVLAPPGVALFNPVQALQQAVTRAWLGDAPNRSLAALREALPEPARAVFDAFVGAYHAAWLEASNAHQLPRWTAEDAWADGRVASRWKRFALLLTPAQCEALALRHAPSLARPDALATDGWALESGGRAPLPRAPRPTPTLRPRSAAPAAPLPAPAAPRSPQQSLFVH